MSSTIFLRNVFPAAVVLRAVLFIYGLWQDAFSPMKYTDIDYYVFTDAARFVAAGQSPYDRETYRYTPLLAWLLIPITWSDWMFSYGKVVFAVADIIAGWLMYKVLRTKGQFSDQKAAWLSCVWLLNPMVAAISTRGSSEGLLGVLMMLMLWAISQSRIKLAAVVLGAAVHFKIYPFIYAFSILWSLDGPITKGKIKPPTSWLQAALEFANPNRIWLTLLSFSTFMSLNLVMFSM
jgi:phosphatidylinositol glycan class M